MRGTQDHQSALPLWSGLAPRFLNADVDEPSCPSFSSLEEFADGDGKDHLDLQSHLARCPRCALMFAALRSAACANSLPAQFAVPLVVLDLPPAGEWDGAAYQILGQISLDSLVFKTCAVVDWSANPMLIRVNLVLDECSDFLSLVLLDVPDEIATVTIATPRGQESMVKTPDGCYEFVRTLEEYQREGDSAENFITYLNAGLLQIVFERPVGDSGLKYQSEVLDLLAAASVVERAYDYVLPSGLHSDTHLRVGKLCHSEVWLEEIAGAFNKIFCDVDFDVIAAAGWPMATIARRLAALRGAPKKSIPQVLLCEGYTPPRILGDIAAQSRVLILVDVVVTGGLVSRLAAAVRQTGALVVGAGAVAQSQHACALPRGLLRPLCRVPMHIVAPRDCPRCGRLERREFNPFANCMTAKVPTARSPSQFLDYSPNAREFWEYVDAVGAYEHHRIERGTHYVAFVDTLKILTHKQIGPQVIRKLCEVLLENSAPPEILLVPNLQRAKTLSDGLTSVLSAGRLQRRIRIVTARSRDGHWYLSHTARNSLYGRSVLIVDSAAGHGQTIDELSLLARRSGSTNVGAAVLLSRMTESAEEGFRARLSGGFHRLYHLPVRPILISCDDRDVCPVCQRKAAVTNAAQESRLEAIKQLATWLSQRAGRTRSQVDVDRVSTSTRQMTLFPVETSFLATCSSRVASGVTLHSLHAAMTNGMAPLALPELSDNQIPQRNRLAILENLPVGVVEWSRGTLDMQLQQLLAREATSSLWRASVGVLARERHVEWVEHLEGFLERCTDAGPRPLFWNNLVCSAYIASHGDSQAKGELRQRVEAILRTHEDALSAVGLRQILEAVNDAPTV